MGKITLEEISKHLLDIDTNEVLQDNFVGIGIQIDKDGFGYHSVLAIGVDKKYYIFHFGKTVALTETPISGQKYFIKYINEIIDPQFSISFLIHCKRIMNFPPPQYGHIFNNAYYNSDGKYISDNSVTNFATCVGFCINTLAIFVNAESYFELSDWSNDGMLEFEIQHPNYFHWFYENFSLSNPNVTPEQFDALYKRITPTDYTASGYLSNLPIRKAQINAIILDVKQAIKSKADVA